MLLRARTGGTAHAVIERRGRWYVLSLHHQCSLSNALASGFDRHTEIIAAANAPSATVVTTDGVVLRRYRGTRFFVGPNVDQETWLGDDLGFLETIRDNSGFEE